MNDAKKFKHERIDREIERSIKKRLQNKFTLIKCRILVVTFYLVHCNLTHELLLPDIFLAVSEDPNLYPFGQGQGDIQLSSFDDATSPPISLPTCFPFGRARHRFAYVLHFVAVGSFSLFLLCVDI